MAESFVGRTKYIAKCRLSLRFEIKLHCGGPCISSFGKD